MKRILLSILAAAAVSFSGISASAQTSSPTESLQKATEGIVSDPALKEAVISISARKGDGTVLVDINAEDMVIPASNMKLITTGAAMYAFGPDHRFETSIGYDGEIKDGVLDGDIYIIGGGDPTIGSKDSIATALETVFGQWEEFIRNAGIRRVNGRIIGDGRYFDGKGGHWPAALPTPPGRK